MRHPFVFVLTVVALTASCAPKSQMRVNDPGSAGVSEPGPPVIWLTPASTTDSARLEPWRSAVGAPVFRPRAAPRSDTWPSDLALRVVAWNTHVGAGDIFGFLESELGFACDETTPQPVARLGGATGPFILLIQEAFRRGSGLPEVTDGAGVPPQIVGETESGVRTTIEDVATRCGLSLFYVPSMRNGSTSGPEAEDRGNAVLSTLDLGMPVAIELPFEAQRRVAVAATVRGPDGVPLLLVSLHLDVAVPLMRVLRTGNGTRVRQGSGLVAGLALLPDTSVATLVGGDFNTWSEGETVIKRMVVAFPDSPPPEDEPTRGAFPADHMFFRAAGSGITLDTTRYLTYENAHSSDHKARGVVLCFCGRSEGARTDTPPTKEKQ